MKTLAVQELQFDHERPSVEEIRNALDLSCEKNLLNCRNWPQYSYNPEVTFRIGYGLPGIAIEYSVTEQNVQATNTKINSMVCEDSCVEFFVSPVKDGIYYNFEFNCLGTPRLGWGTNRSNNQLVDPKIVQTITRDASLGSAPFSEQEGTFTWQLLVVIPLSTFVKHTLESVKGITMYANFYKCGDFLSNKHYLSWNPIGTAVPDFHVPHCFGRLRFC